MDAETVRVVISNMRSPINSRQRVQFTSRAILFLVKLFEGKRVDVIDVYCILLRLAYASTGLHDDRRFINLRDVVVYLCSNLPTSISLQDIYDISLIFNIDNDSTYKEVYDMKILIDTIM